MVSMESTAWRAHPRSRAPAREQPICKALLHTFQHICQGVPPAPQVEGLPSRQLEAAGLEPARQPLRWKGPLQFTHNLVSQTTGITPRPMQIYGQVGGQLGRQCCSLMASRHPPTPTRMGGVEQGLAQPHREEWSKALHNHPDSSLRKYLLSGIREGFRIGFDNL